MGSKAQVHAQLTGTFIHYDGFIKAYKNHLCAISTPQKYPDDDQRTIPG
jgi:hypothetical protein